MANITLRCSDQRLNDIINKKFPEDLILAELGGVKWHMARDNMEELAEQIEFVIEHKNTKRINLVAHTDCALYKELGEDHPGKPIDDLKDTARELAERFPTLEVVSYLYDVDSRNLEKIDSK